MMLIAASLMATGQPMTYTNQREELHLAGSVVIADLQAHGEKWFDENYAEFEEGSPEASWISNLQETQVEIYLGTWCGDSREWVPQFVHLWDALGLDRDQLTFTCLYDGTEKYKQGPNGEEQGKDIHRVPTFIFTENGAEYARIVEYPASDLMTDVAQIALRYPSQPNYKAATYMQQLLSEMTTEEVYKNANDYLRKAYKLTGKSSELNTLGYVYLRSGRVSEALIAFHFNTFMFRHEPNVYDSYAEALVIAGDTTNAITNYEKVLELDADNENAIAQLEKLKVRDMINE